MYPKERKVDITNLPPHQLAVFRLIFHKRIVIVHHEQNPLVGKNIINAEGAEDAEKERSV